MSQVTLHLSASQLRSPKLENGEAPPSQMVTAKDPSEGAVARIVSSLAEEARRSPNPVLRSILPVIQSSRFVSTDVPKILEVAKNLGDKISEPSSWKFPSFIQEDSEKTIQFFMIGNSLNFKFWKDSSKERFATEYQGTKWEGATGMWACLRRAYEEGVPILDAAYLSKLTLAQARQIFRGNMEIPMLKERVEILNEVGKVLQEKYGGSFVNLYRGSDGYAFQNGRGMVERLVNDFPSFRDEALDPVTGKNVKFNKRAQLAVAMLASRLNGTGLFEAKDLKNLTVFADYELPKSLQHLGILRYDPALESAVTSGSLIPKGSRREIEIRAHTIYAAKLLELALKKSGKDVNPLHVDYLLWSQGKGLKEKPHHLTETTAY